MAHKMRLIWRAEHPVDALPSGSLLKSLSDAVNIRRYDYRPSCLFLPFFLGFRLMLNKAYFVSQGKPGGISQEEFFWHCSQDKVRLV